MMTEYINQREVSDRLIKLETKLELKFQEMDRALDTRTAELERRLQGLNELRSDVLKDRDQFVHKGIYEVERKELHQLSNRMTAVETRIVTWGAALAVVMVLAQMVIKMLWK